MKLFQQLLVAPAALGLMAPVAATAAELNINDVSEYSNPSEVQSINQFSDVYPTDWAYQALTNLAERHGCVASAPNGSMTRYEAAALLNKCLGQVAEVNAEERRLLNEFAPELAVIKGRVDGLESRVSEFEAGVFSSTTKLSGKTTFLFGGAQQDNSTTEAVTFTYDTQIALDSSFSGSDLLKTVVRAGNVNDGDPFSNSGTAPLEINSEATESNNLTVVRSYYQFPVGDDFTATVGAKVRQDDMLGVWPSAYPTDSVLDALTYAGANDAYNLSEGAGAGITYAKDNLSASLLVISEEADATSASAGVLTSEGSDDVTAQVAWVGEGFTLAAAYTVSDGGVNDEDAVATTDAERAQDYTAWGFSGVYEFDQESTWVPASISAGFGFKDHDEEVENAVQDGNTWSLGVIWENVGIDGNTLGFAYGTAELHSDLNDDDPMTYEVYYSIPVSDNITVTPAFFAVEKNDAEDYTGGIVKTTFTF
jgi:hypothetical protein